MSKIRLDELKAALERRRPPAAKSEAAYKRELVSQVNDLACSWARRIEDRWAVGVLDLIIKLPGIPLFFAEGKLIKGNLFGPSPAQYREGLRLLDADVHAILVGWKEGKMYVSTWAEQVDYRNCHPIFDESYAQTLFKFMQIAEKAK